MAGKQERQRKLARERHERRIAREAARQQRTRQMTKYVSGGLVLLVLIGIVTVTAWHLTKSNAAAPKTSPSVSPTASSPSASPSPSPTPSQSTSATGIVQCSYVPHPPATKNVGIPPSGANAKAKYQATIKTNRGDIVISLLNAQAPCTVNSFVYLAEKGFYNSTPCPRLVTSGIYVLQCGDPSGTGSGGPGYEFADENLAGATYPAGTLAMANAGPNTNGSQFFMVYKDTAGLAPSYTPFGTVVSGLSVLQSIAKAGYGPPLNPAGGGQPKQKVTIESVTIKKT
ncbi:MAG TPA: peptidylprolyl isomerase [Streptosporangiaceae bacterium]